MRKFEEVKQEFIKFPNVQTRMPERGDSMSAGYDFCSKEDYTMEPGESHLFWTDVCAKMFFDNVLQIYPRSGLGCKNGLILKNSVGIIDASYYGNAKNGGNIGICLINTGSEAYTIHIGDRIAQGIFGRYLITDDDKFMNTKQESSRAGGFGSTGQ